MIKVVNHTYRHISYTLQYQQQPICLSHHLHRLHQCFHNSLGENQLRIDSMNKKFAQVKSMFELFVSNIHDVELKNYVTDIIKQFNELIEIQ